MILLPLLLAATTACDNAQTQAAMNVCAAGEYRAADAEMTRAWRVAYQAMKRRDAADTSRGGGAGYAAALLTAQRAWLAYRDAECVVEGLQYARGSIQGIVVARCRAGLTKARTGQFRSLAERR